ncbi:glycosyltransferase family 2 protein [Saccharicrinis sp. FJH54]|uniref:glycosyltransferase family 2 protein n=1 Tax=Saccharicrinis sp. FJH54 TaxID=3344665 RepID=UPI0035D4DB9E
MSKISVFIPVYNGVKYLQQTLESILKQSFKEFEVLCIDDGSSDESLIILNEFARTNERIKVFSKPNEGSVPYSWKYVFPFIKSEYTCYLSQDDIFAPDFLSKQYNKAIETDADAVVPVVEYYFESSQQNVISRGLNGRLDVELPGRDAFIYSLDWQISGFALWKTALIKRIGIKTDAFNSDELAQRLWFLNCNKVVFSDARFYYRQDNPNAITKSFGYYQYSTVKTNLHLLHKMREIKLEKKVIEKFHRKYFISLFYLKAKAIQNQKNYSEKQNIELKKLFTQNFQELRNLPVDDIGSIEKIKFRLLSTNSFLFNLAAQLFALKIKLTA